MLFYKFFKFFSQDSYRPIEQPAAVSGMKTRFCGDNILAVSPINDTAQNDDICQCFCCHSMPMPNYRQQNRQYPVFRVLDNNDSI